MVEPIRLAQAEVGQIVAHDPEAAGANVSSRAGTVDSHSNQIAAARMCRSRPNRAPATTFVITR
jgi:hypothetical protein